MATKKQKAEVVEVSIKPVDMRTVTLKIVGDTPLVVHQWSEKARKQMLDMQTSEDQKGKKRKVHPIKIPVRDYVNSLYFLTNHPDIDDRDVFTEAEAKAIEEDTYQKYSDAIAAGAKFGFPAVAIKQAGATGAFRLGMASNIKNNLSHFS